MNDRAEFLKRRKQFIGGSDISAILGMSQYKTALDLYFDKTSEEINLDEMSQPAYWGTQLEDVVANEYSKRTGIPIRVEPNTILHPEYPFLGASIDRWAGDHILECKTAGFMQGKQWGESGTDAIPTAYLLQTAWYSMVCNVNRVDIAVLIGGNDFRIYTYNKNTVLEDKIKEAAISFWNNHVVPRIPPEPISNTDTLKLYENSTFGATISADDKILELIAEIKAHKTQIKRLTTIIKNKSTEVFNYMKDAEILIDLNGNPLATWRNQNVSRFDAKAFKAEYNDLYSKYTKATSTRVFRLKGENDNEETE
jgi:putative phage-type endonuclease